MDIAERKFMYKKGPKIAIVVGTRAQMIKMAPVFQAFDRLGASYWFLHTGQHNDTFDDLREEFNIRAPDVIAAGADEAKTIGKLLKWIGSAITETVLKNHSLLPVRNGIVLVHGDTLSTLWGAILGKATRNKVLHVEAGLRSKYLLHPFPEEIVRRLVGILATHHACPGEESTRAIRAASENIYNTQGNTLLDSVSYALKKKRVNDQIPDKPYAIASVHRAETLYRESRLKKAILIFETLADYKKLLVVGHPSLLSRLKKENLRQRLEANSNIQIIPRMPYTPFIKLLKNADLLVTDGGSNQEESSYLSIPTLILRKATERLEGIGSNARLIGLSVNEVIRFFDNPEALSTSHKIQDARPSEKIAKWACMIVKD